jgi:hypothetical protein
MRIYKNKTGTYDVLTPAGLLFHVNSNQCKLVGHVTERWRHNEKQLTRIPREVAKFRAKFEL